MSTKSKVFKIIGSALLLCNILVFFLPMITITGPSGMMLALESGVKGELAEYKAYLEELELDEVTSVKKLYEQDSYGCSQLDVCILTANFNKRIEEVRDELNNADALNNPLRDVLGITDLIDLKLPETSIMVVVCVFLIIIPLTVNLIGGLLGVLLKKKNLIYRIMSVVSFLCSLLVLIMILITSGRLNSGVESYNEKMKLIAPETIAGFGLSDFNISFKISAHVGIGTILSIVLCTAALVMAILSMVFYKKKESIETWGDTTQNNMFQPYATEMPIAQPDCARGVLVGLTGDYAGAEIDCSQDKIVCGRDSSCCNLIFNNNAYKVSRRHCEISYNANTDKFEIIDYSSNGTFKNGDTNCIPQNMVITLERGTILDIGDETNRFQLD